MVADSTSARSRAARSRAWLLTSSAMSAREPRSGMTANRKTSSLRRIRLAPSVSAARGGPKELARTGARPAEGEDGLGQRGHQLGEARHFLGALVARCDRQE